MTEMTKPIETKEEAREKLIMARKSKKIEKNYDDKGDEYKTKNLGELRKICKDRVIKISGVKQQLIERLIDWDDEQKCLEEKQHEDEDMVKEIPSNFDEDETNEEIDGEIDGEIDDESENETKD
jgi:hypothetical protein